MKKTRHKNSVGLVLNEAAVVEAPTLTEGTYQTLTFNIVATKATIRHETLEGRDYMVVPAVILTEGVHNGSNGPLYYPPEELSKTPMVWNHKPVVVYHPQENGNAVSACTPAVIAKRKVGMMMNTEFKGGRLRTEAWLEKDRLKAVDIRVLNALDKGQMVEVSTGLFTDNEVKDGIWKNEPYSAVARNYRPDHLAILPDMKGSCSIADGAGLLRNEAFGPNVALVDVFPTFCIHEKEGKLFKQAYTRNGDVVSLTGLPQEVTKSRTYKTLDGQVVNTEQGEGSMDKKALVDSLIQNENSPWEAGDREFLMGKSEDFLKGLTPTANADCDVCGEDPCVCTEAEKKKAKEDGTPAGNAAAPALTVLPAKPKTVEEFITNAPPEMQDVLRSGLRAHQAQKDQLITIITANKANQFSKENLQSKDLRELQAIASLARNTESASASRPPLYLGQGGDPGVGQPTGNEEQEALVAPVMNFEKTE